MRIRRFTLCAIFIGIAAGSTGCQSILSRGAAKDDLNPAMSVNSHETQYVANVTGVWGLDFGKVEGVGLVTGLHGTGSDPAPSGQREYLLNELKTYEEIDDPTALLASQDTSMVLIKGLVPPGARKGDRFDLEVILPPRPRSETTSLKHGFLSRTRLRPMVELGGKVRKGNTAAVGRGSVLVDGLFDARQDQSNEVRGLILGGGVALEDRTLGLTIRTDDNPIRKATSISRSINERFTTVTRDGRSGVATPKNDKIIELLVPDNYRVNVGRYFQVIGQIAFDETPQQRVNRLEQLDRELQQPVSCREAALRLEAMGLDGVPALKRGVLSRDLEIRFQAAQSLAYLNDTAAVEVLKLAAEQEPAFRWHALTALASMKEPEAANALTELMHVESAETRYGAFRAYQTRSPDDQFSKGTWLADDFYLNIVPSTASPMLHLSRSRRPEIVVFGENQFFSDNYVFADSGLTIKADGKGSVLLIRYLPNHAEERRVSTTATADVIRNLASLGCSYTTMVEILRSAKRDEMLSSRLVVNAVPRLNREYVPNDDQELTQTGSRFQAGPLPDLFRPADNTESPVPRDDVAALSEVEDEEGIETKSRARPWKNWLGLKK